MDVILMTVLLTTIGLCLVAFLVWLGIMSIQLMRFRKKAEGALKHLERWIDDNNNGIQRRVDDVVTELNASIFNTENNTQTMINGVYTTISENNNEMNRRVNQVYPDIYRTVDKHVSDLNSKIDSRCDKVQDKIEINYKLLKDDHSKTDWLWKKIALNNNFLDVNQEQKVEE